MKRASTCALALGLIAACRKGGPPPPDSTPPPATSAATVRSAPVDHLAKGELVEGKDAILGLVLPRDMRVQWNFGNQGLAIGDVEPEQVANYVRARVSGGKLSVGASQTLFEDVHAGKDERALRIKIERAKGKCLLEVRDMSPGPAPPGPPAETDAERWRRAGFDPTGKPLDPNMK